MADILDLASGGSSDQGLLTPEESQSGSAQQLLTDWGETFGDQTVQDVRNPNRTNGTIANSQANEYHLSWEQIMASIDSEAIGGADALPTSSYADPATVAFVSQTEAPYWHAESAIPAQPRIHEPNYDQASSYDDLHIQFDTYDNPTPCDPRDGPNLPIPRRRPVEFTAAQTPDYSITVPSLPVPGRRRNETIITQYEVSSPTTHLGLNKKSAREIEKISEDLALVSYPTSIKDIPGLDLHYPAEWLEGGFFDPENPEDISSFTQGEQNWSVETPPAILGMLDPSPGIVNLHGVPVPALKNRKGRNVIHPGNGIPLRNIKFLPRYLSSQLSEVAIEVFFRLDPRVKYDDLRGRQPRWVAKQSHNELNTLNNRRIRRVRGPLRVRDWSGKYADRPTKGLLEILDSLSDEQIRLNTTWVAVADGVHPPNNPDWLLPRTAFRAHNHRMSNEVRLGLALLQKLKARAAELGLESWKMLPPEEKPKEWGMRLAGKRLESKRKREEMEAGKGKGKKKEKNEGEEEGEDEQVEREVSEVRAKRPRRGVQAAMFGP